MVYITPGLFGRDPTQERHICPFSSHPHLRNAMVDAQPSLGKRKRRPEDDKDGSSSKPNITSPTDRSGSTSQTSPSKSTLSSNHERRPVKQMKRSNPKLTKTPSHLMDVEPSPAPHPDSPSVQWPDTPTTQTHTGTPTADLRPCHACSTAPKRKRDLENYMDCRRCVGRTCYICARECLGCAKAICKKCIVEVGEEGDPWCLECYQCVNT